MSNCTLGPDEIHVWSTSLIRTPEVVHELEQILAEDELARAKRFHFVRDQNGFAVGRGVLRGILASYLRCQAREIKFSYSQLGKPSLSDSSAGLQFNLAHSGGLAVYAITRNREIGVDVEAIRPITEIAAIARRFFAPGETTRLLSLPQEQRVQAFFNCWTRKEAYLKATGLGIGGGLDQFEVSLEPGAPAKLLSHLLHPDEADLWTIFDLRPAPETVAALAVKGQGIKLHSWRWANPRAG
jgi:4'-phosphopantetheinyl transferase